MSLRAQAEADLSFTIEDPVGGFGWACSLVDPAGTVFELVALTQDIAAIIDPDTGVGVKGRWTTVAFRKSSLPAGVEAVQTGVGDTGKPWQVLFDDINGQPGNFKIVETWDDATIGCLVCRLEPYTPAP